MKKKWRFKVKLLANKRSVNKILTRAWW